MSLSATILGRRRQSARRIPKGLATADDTLRCAQDRQRLACMSAYRPQLMSDRSAAQICGVSVRMVRMWVETGAWPLPEAVRAMTLYFMMSDLECWLESGTWPDHVHFRF